MMSFICGSRGLAAGRRVWGGQAAGRRGREVTVHPEEARSAVSKGVSKDTGRRENKGSALAITLLFLFLLSIMALQAMSSSYLQIKMEQNFEHAAVRFYAAESGLAAGEKKLIEFSKTNDNAKNTDVIFTIDYQGINVHYVIRSLPSFFCRANFYQVTSWVQEGELPAIQLQTTDAVLSHRECEKSELVVLGRTSWREL